MLQRRPSVIRTEAYLLYYFGPEGKIAQIIHQARCSLAHDPERDQYGVVLTLLDALARVNCEIQRQIVPLASGWGGPVKIIMRQQQVVQMLSDVSHEHLENPAKDVLDLLVKKSLLGKEELMALHEMLIEYSEGLKRESSRRIVAEFLKNFQDRLADLSEKKEGVFEVCNDQEVDRFFKKEWIILLFMKLSHTLRYVRDDFTSLPFEHNRLNKIIKNLDIGIEFFEELLRSSMHVQEDTRLANMAFEVHVLNQQSPLRMRAPWSKPSPLRQQHEALNCSFAQWACREGLASYKMHWIVWIMNSRYFSFMKSVLMPSLSKSLCDVRLKSITKDRLSEEDEALFEQLKKQIVGIFAQKGLVLSTDLTLPQSFVTDKERSQKEAVQQESVQEDHVKNEVAEQHDQKKKEKKPKKEKPNKSFFFRLKLMSPRLSAKSEKNTKKSNDNFCMRS